MVFGILAWFFISHHVFESKNHPQNIDSLSSNENEKLRYEALLESIGDGLIVTNREGKITTFNKTAESMLNLSSKSVLGKRLEEVIKIEYDGRQNSAKENNIQGAIKSQAGDYSLYFVRADGSRFPVSTKVTSYVHGTEVLGTITLFRDVTIERNIDQMKTDFISLASHQLKTPLSAIRWYTEMLINGDGGKLLPQQMVFAKNISVSIIRMIELVNALLNVSRIESGRIMVEAQPVNMKEFISGIVAEVRARADQKKQKISVNISDDIPIINLDPELTRQIYLNLLSNAVKYTQDNGEISLVVSIKGTEIISEVRDNGFGIPESEQSRVFSRFFRGNNIIGRGSTGTGLGLYLTRAIVELAKGKIWFRSLEGKGTTFSFSLPVRGVSKEGIAKIDSFGIDV